MWAVYKLIIFATSALNYSFIVTGNDSCIKGIFRTLLLMQMLCAEEAVIYRAENVTFRTLGGKNIFKSPMKLNMTKCNKSLNKIINNVQ